MNMMGTAHCLLLLLSLHLSLGGHGWNYDVKSESGPLHWEYDCAGAEQSPVSLPGDAPVTVLPPLVLEHYDQLPLSAMLRNNGHTAKITPQPKRPEATPTMSGGGLGHGYKLAQAHFHWGSGDRRGSEHVIGTTAFPMELHLVHYKAVHSSLGEALQEGAFDSLAVLGVFFSVQLGGLVHVPSLETVTAAMENITTANTEIEVTPFPFSDLLPADLSHFYRYNGSLTTPSCNEIVQWTVLKQPVQISPSQLRPFRALLDADGHHLVDNFRPTQPIGSRDILLVETEEPAMLESAALVAEGDNETVEENLSDATLVATSPSGAVQGVKSLTGMGTQIVKFKGIPYAEAPVGELRLQDPVPVLPWGGVKEAADEPPACPQLDENRTVIGSEDCLYLNVYTPDIKPKILKPVMIWIHGGSSHQHQVSFSTGEASEASYNPELFLDEDIVFVSVQYRLGLLGFLSMPGSTRINSNIGLLDQREAMRWVKSNIAYYGGDPHRVTICGQSSGAVSVHTHVLTEDDEELFEAAVAQSGTVLTTFGHDVQTSSTAAVSALGCQGDAYSSDEVLRCLQSVSIESLIEQHFEAWPVHTRSSTHLTYPFQLSTKLEGAKKNIPFLIGVNAEEAGSMDYANVQKAASPLLKFVYKDQPAQLATDALFVMPAYQALSQHGEHGPVYGYVLAELCAASGSAGTRVTHGEDLACLFSRENRIGGQALVRSWANFAKYHQPSPAWDTVPGWHHGRLGQIAVFGDLETVGEGVKDMWQRIQLWEILGKEDEEH